MRRTSTAILVVLTLALATPTTIATWNALGTFEPDTRLDQQGGFMYLNPNVDKVERAYLNVVPMQRNTESNPNVGALQSRILFPGNLGFDAFFGSWIDCNLDGYVGHIETILFEYPSQLLPANSPCLDPVLMSKTTPYNQQGWVTEMRWIRNPFATPNSYAGFDGNEDGVPDGRDKRNIQDLGATIWGDFGVPGDTMGREVCPQNRPAGTTQRTGAFLNWADCFGGHRLFDNAQPILTSAGMGFAEERNFDQPGHPLNVNTLGADDGSDSYVGAWDCSTQPQGIPVGPANVGSPAHQNATANNQQYTVPWVTATDENGELNVTVWNAGNYSDDYKVEEAANVDPQTPRDLSPAPSTTGTIAGTYNHTRQGTTGSCESRQSVYDNFESRTAQQERADQKTRVTTRFTFYEEQRSGSNAQGQPFYGAQVYPIVRSGLLTIVEGTSWYSEGTAPSELGNTGPTPPQLVRTSDLQPEGAIYWTFYANMTTQSLSKLQIASPAPGVYGTEWCSVSSDPKLNGGFVCDANAWYRDPNGDRIPDTEFHPAPGHAYHLRDVDCYDGTIMSADPVTGTDTSVAKASLVEFSTTGGCIGPEN